MERKSSLMKTLSSIAELADLPGPFCVAIGVFDGVHLGHQELIRRTFAEAKRQKALAVALTFDPHPARVLRPDSAPHLLTATPHKLRLLAELGCPVTVCQRFDAAFAAQSPEEFIRVLARAARPLKTVCVGHNWTFGKNRAGTVEVLEHCGRTLDFETIAIAPVMADGEWVSSTRIRRAVAAGDLDLARRLLGRDYTLLGTVRQGRHLGTRLGFPTANLAAHHELFPPDGVYAVRAFLRGQWRDGVANVGTRPTVTDSPERVLEVHVFDFSGDCQGEDLEVRFEGFLREEKKFPTVDALKAQITEDVRQAHARLAQ